MARFSDLNQEQRLALGVVAVIGAATLVFFVMSLRKSISDPFYRDPGKLGTFKTSSVLEEERLEKLKTSDTDGDGLFDYDELYVFRTSPFLEDSDSDGDPDGKEVAAGADPNCPKDKTCASSGTASSGQAGIIPTLGQSVLTGATSPENAAMTSSGPLQTMVEVFGDLQSLTLEKAEARLRQMSSAELRQFMVKLGLPADVIGKADDETLIRLLIETFRETGVRSENAAASGGQSGQ